MTARQTRIGFIGAGPKALATALRLVAHLDASDRVELVFVDPHPAGPGLVWNTSQPMALLNNTPASGTTIFADATVASAAPVEDGPSMAQWCANPVWQGALSPELRAVASTIGPWSAPPRALQGHYYRWAFDRITGRHSGVSIREVSARAQRVSRHGAREIIVLDEGSEIEVDVVVVSPGFLDEEQTEADALLAGGGGAYVPPGMASVAAFARIDWGSPVLVRGIGATFFDLLGLLQARALPRPDRLSLVVGSGAGLPKRSQPGAIGVEVMPRLLTETWAARMIELHAGRGSLDFAREVRPLIDDELERVFDERPVPASLDDGLAPFRSLASPGPEGAIGADGWNTVVARFAGQERLGIERPANSPWLAGRSVLVNARRVVLALDRVGAFSPGSQLREGFLAPVGRVTSGPPSVRTALLLTLLEAGELELLGPGTRVIADGARFTARSELTGLSAIADQLVEAWQRFGTVGRSTNSLIRALLDSGEGALATSDPNSLAADSEGRILDIGGVSADRRFVLGHVARASQYGVNQGAVPQSSDPFLIEADTVARAISQLVRRHSGTRDLRIDSSATIVDVGRPR